MANVKTKDRVLEIHHLKPTPGSKPSKTRVGRGEASKGKTAGRGTKGTKARYQVKVGFEGGQMPLHMRLPKYRGFKNPNKKQYAVINLDRLSASFPKGGKVTPIELISKGLSGTNELVKILGDGNVDLKFELQVNAASKSAIEKIEKAGGKVELI